MNPLEQKGVAVENQFRSWSTVTYAASSRR